MPLPLRAKQSFYHSLAQLLRAGVTFPSALEKLSRTTRGPLHSVINRLRSALDAGATVGEACEAQRGAISQTEASVIAAVEKGGKLEHGLEQLATYFEALAFARETVIRKSLYPIFVLHFGILSLGLPALFTGSPGVYLRQTGTIFAIIYGVALAAALLLPFLRDAGAMKPGTDRLLRAIPVIGKLRRSFAIARFCMIYQVELDAGVNVLDALTAAGRASRSGRIRAAVDAALPEIRNGAQVGPLLADSRAFPEEVTRAILIGEESGELDAELRRLAANYQTDALVRLQSAADWFTKLIYFGVVIYLGWRIVKTYEGYTSQIQQLIDQ